MDLSKLGCFIEIDKVGRSPHREKYIYKDLVCILDGG